jgi:hypothetical protein
MEKIFKVLVRNKTNRRDFIKDIKERNVYLKIEVNGKIDSTSAEAPGGLEAFEVALRKLLLLHYPDEINRLKVVSFTTNYIDVANKGTGAKVQACVGMRYNGDDIQFWGEPDFDYFETGCMAITRGYQKCLSRMLKKETIAA